MRVYTDLHRELKIRAARAGKSMLQLSSEILRKGLKELDNKGAPSSRQKP